MKHMIETFRKHPVAAVVYLLVDLAVGWYLLAHPELQVGILDAVRSLVAKVFLAAIAATP